MFLFFTKDVILISIQDHDEISTLVPVECFEEPVCKTVAVQTTLTGIELDEILNGLRREKKILQQKLIRRNQRIANTVSLIEALKEKRLLNDDGEEIIRSQLSYKKNNYSECWFINISYFYLFIFYLFIYLFHVTIVP